GLGADVPLGPTGRPRVLRFTLLALVRVATCARVRHDRLAARGTSPYGGGGRGNARAGGGFPRRGPGFANPHPNHSRAVCCSDALLRSRRAAKPILVTSPALLA